LRGKYHLPSVLLLPQCRGRRNDLLVGHTTLLTSMRPWAMCGRSWRITLNVVLLGLQGSLNKFLMDDKGSTVIAVFGLPPLAHEDDAVRGVLSSLMICAQLFPLGLVPAIGKHSLVS